MKSSAIALSLLFALAALSPAQDTRGKIQGTVSDASGAVVPAANVTLVNTETNVQATAQTNQSGHYIFDFVVPGSYTVTVESSGFRNFVQKNIRVEALSDITVNAALQVGNAGESVTVEATPVAVEFNTSTMANTVDTKMANTLPLVSRNPFLFVELNPAVILTSTKEREPFHFWAGSQFDVGGNTNDKNDLLLDGTPSMTTQKSSYTPPPDAVEQVNLQQNSVDAEYGHSAGGVMAMQMKSGTNSFHGTAYFVGRNPNLNAMADRYTGAANNTRQNTYGGTLGNPIIRNKLFNFFAYEGMRISSPLSVIDTLPTAAQRTGDFSQTLNTQGALDTIYDPWTTVTQGSTVTRTPFPNNVIPASRIDPTAALLMKSVWQPNNPGNQYTAANNFKAGYADPYKYWNLMDRSDYNISDKWKVFGRYNILHTTEAIQDYTGGSSLLPLYGSVRNAISTAGDAVWTINPTTVLDIHGGYNYINDSFGYPDRNLKPSDLATIWPSSNWYSSYIPSLPQIYIPGFKVNQGSGTAMGVSSYWYQTPNSWNLESKISKNIGRHYVKFGAEYRRENVNAARPSLASFSFNPALTANTYNSPNTALNGNGWATFLLGALDNGSTASTIPIQMPRNNFIGAFIQDDFHFSSRITVNIGLRYEFFSGLRDPSHRLSAGLDLTNPIPELSGANTPVLPMLAQQLRTTPPIYNGAWNFTSSSNPDSWNPPKLLLEPRIGVAWKINEKTALRAGWARYIIPATLTDSLNILGSVPYPGYAATSTVIAPLQGIPQATLSNPFPGGVVPPTGNTLGRYTALGDTATFFDQNFNPGVNDRLNISLQRQLPAQLLADITFFTNIGHNLPYSQNVNLADPRIAFQAGNQVNTSVANPFYNLLPATQMPGQLRTQAKVAASQLLRPYPQYSDIWQALIGGRGDRYKSLQISVRRPFTNGLNLSVGYNYNREVDQEYYDDVDEYLHRFTWTPTQTPRHRVTVASVYELPFGRGRKYLSGSNRIVDGVLGGWSLSGIYTYNSGIPLRFGSTSTTGTSQSSYVGGSLTSAPIANSGALVSGDPAISNPTAGMWFDTSKVKQLPAFTRATNPVQFNDWLGPRYVNVDLALAKQFPIREWLHMELRVDAFNVPNTFTPANPVTAPTNVNFGKAIDAAAGTYGRQIQYSGKFIF
ncbi:MAG TPA: carboxypeptidase regulatory-like domain-containing protein [Bryobacteraceae bacterium]|nr:carboxypeptidase regulatory-like domain-containing protein [Bryobacteraceae bacterium]